MVCNYTREEHQSVCRSLSYALTLGDEPGWEAFAFVVDAQLNDREKAALSFWSLQAQTQEHAALTSDAAINGTVHQTPPSFLDTPAGRQALIEWREDRDRRRRVND